jgi:hypothetical protein
MVSQIFGEEELKETLEKKPYLYPVGNGPLESLEN